MKFNKADTCSENVKSMTRVEPGVYHCKSCQKNVHDFRHKPVRWIADYIEKNGKPCAFYFEDQIDALNALHDAKEVKHFSLLKAAAFTGLISMGAMGANASVINPINDFNEILKPAVEEVIEINVTDKNGNLLKGKKIRLTINKENSVVLTTGDDGKVTYKIPRGLEFKSYTVEFIETGESKTYNININSEVTQAHCVKFESQQALAVVTMKKIQGRVEWENSRKSLPELSVILFLRTDSTDVEIGSTLTDNKGNFTFEVRADQVQIGKTYVTTVSYNGEDTKFLEAKHVDAKHSKIVLKIKKRARRMMAGAMSF